MSQRCQLPTLHIDEQAMPCASSYPASPESHEATPYGTPHPFSSELAAFSYPLSPDGEEGRWQYDRHCIDSYNEEEREMTFAQMISELSKVSRCRRANSERDTVLE